MSGNWNSQILDISGEFGGKRKSTAYAEKFKKGTSESDIPYKAASTKEVSN